MAALATVLVIVGVLMTIAGAVSLLRPPPTTEDVAHGAISDVTELLEKIIELLDKFDKKYRVGLILIIVGVGLIGAGAFFASLDAKQAAEDSSTAMISLR